MGSGTKVVAATDTDLNTDVFFNYRYGNGYYSTLPRLSLIVSKIGSDKDGKGHSIN